MILQYAGGSGAVAQTYILGVAITPNKPTMKSSEGAAVSFSISPALHAGLFFSTVTGNISGTPSFLQPIVVVCTVSATNTGGTSAPHELSFIIIDKPPVLSAFPPMYFSHGEKAFFAPQMGADGGLATSFTLFPTVLPRGVSLNVSQEETSIPDMIVVYGVYMCCGLELT